MDHTFFPSYRKTLLGPEEILLSIEIPYSREVRRCQKHPESRLLLPGPRQGEQSLLRGPNLAFLHLNMDVLVSETCL